jgi:hypothetical protein
MGEGSFFGMGRASPPPSQKKVLDRCAVLLYYAFTLDWTGERRQAMKSTRHEMAFIYFTYEDFEAMVKRAVMDKHPHLFTDKTWEWEELNVSPELNGINPDKLNDAISLTFAKREEPLKNPVDNATGVVYVRVNEVCR